ncbi:hypothetical protein BFW38_07995 [Terasakiispira papahanaumokuakeensis]|uniref:Uncharacterized protein n=1 Tax=Terasakiispira papahanaumokuakeensis TaxID=197479 RepID=A0A1E2V9J5_9GAMM|nr:hypothetical protein BFW38_07995 [Terasakiispira papahanaumokuakeensis]
MTKNSFVIRVRLSTTKWIGGEPYAGWSTGHKETRQPEGSRARPAITGRHKKAPMALLCAFVNRATKPGH